MYRQIERVGRVCYKSEDHCTPDSARPFVERMLKNRHLAMLEHGTVYLQVDMATGNESATMGSAYDRYRANKFSVTHVHGGVAYITTNLRVLAENGWMDDLRLFCELTEHHERRVTVHFTTQIAITREFNRHRADSMAEQSTRYCNYSKAKFGNEIAVNLPQFVGALPQGSLTESVAEGDIDITGADLVELARKAQEARVVLPLDTNTELVHTAFVADWRHFFDLRALGTTGAPHPDAKALAQPLYERFVEEGWIEADR